MEREEEADGSGGGSGFLGREKKWEKTNGLSFLLMLIEAGRQKNGKEVGDATKSRPAKSPSSSSPH